MAGFRVHVTTSACLGAIVGVYGSGQLNYDWGTAMLAAGLTAIGGMLPDLDSDSGVPLRETFGLAGFVVPLLLMERLGRQVANAEQLLVLLGGTYLLVRYGGASLFKHFTVHRGMFHSIPAMLIAGLCVFLMHRPNHQLLADEVRMRAYLAIGTMIGFLSHLVLDELYAVNLMGVIPRLNKYAGSAMKWRSDSWSATLFAYAILFALAYAAWVSLGSPIWS